MIQIFGCRSELFSDILGFTFFMLFDFAGHYPSNLLEKVAGKELCPAAERRSHTAPGMGETGRTQETEGKSRKNKKRMGKKDESQDKGGL